MTIYDFRSHTVTLPTPSMMAAITTAPLGDSARGDDPTVLRLEQLGRQLTGKDDALFIPSGTMANLAAIIAHECRGGEVIVEGTAHIYNSEGGGLSVVAGAVARPIKGQHGVLAAADVKVTIKDGSDQALAPTKLICLETTHNAAGGTVIPLAEMAAVHAIAQQARVPVHLDGPAFSTRPPTSTCPSSRSAGTSIPCGSHCARGSAARSVPFSPATTRS